MPLLARLVLAVAVALGAAGCGGGASVVEPEASGPPAPAVVRPGAPGEASRTAAVDPLPDLGHTEADVRFMQDMIHHHAQALEMARLVPDRTDRADVRALALRIELSQADEIALMRKWLADRGRPVPMAAEGHGHHGPRELPPPDHGDHHGGHHHHGHAHHADAHDPHAGMPGMLTPEQMRRMAEATGDAFVRLFLEGMIFHHEGALVMVEQLLSAEGAAQDTELFAFASHVDSDQRLEILRMRRLLETLPQPTTE